MKINQSINTGGKKLLEISWLFRRKLTKVELNDSHEACDVTKEKKVSLIIKFNKRTIFLTKCGIYEIYNFFWTHYLTGIIDLGIIIA